MKVICKIESKILLCHQRLNNYFKKLCFDTYQDFPILTQDILIAPI